MNRKKTLGDAIAYAAVKHCGQTRVDGLPYIVHPMAVWEMVRDLGFDESYQITALLHDILEDTDGTEEEIAAFGTDVLEAVKLLTRPKGADEAEYVAKILENHMAAVVKNADKLQNLRDCVACSDEEFAAQYINKAKAYYDEKFSPELSSAIRNAPLLRKSKKPMHPYRPEKCMLYTDIEKGWKKARKIKYQEGFIKPDFNYPNIQFWRKSLSGVAYYCTYDWPGEIGEPVPTWILSPIGWVPNNINLKDWYDYCTELSRDEILKLIDQKTKENYFEDYVDLDKIW